MLSCIVVVGLGGRGRGVGAGGGPGDGESVFIWGKKVPVASYEKSAVEGVGEGKCDVFVHLSSTAAGYWGGKVLVVHIPIDSSGVL